MTIEKINLGKNDHFSTPSLIDAMTSFEHKYLHKLIVEGASCRFVPSCRFCNKNIEKIDNNDSCKNIFICFFKIFKICIGCLEVSIRKGWENLNGSKSKNFISFPFGSKG